MTLTREERDQIVRRLTELKLQAYGPSGNDLSTEQLRAIGREEEALLKRYEEGLPELSISRCPYCGTPVTIRIDLYGLDGPFWKQQGGDVFTSACRHFLTYQGALNYRGYVPTREETGIYNEIHSGPEIPFVIRRLMGLPGVKCIVSSFTILDGRYNAYFMCYFADPPLPMSEGHQTWLRQQYYWTGPDGQLRWDIRNDAWDFDLGRWMARPGPVLGWIEPDDQSLKLHWPPEQSVYRKAQGRPYPLVLRRGDLRETPPPDGTPLDLFD
jgi:hypothetical protein